MQSNKQSGFVLIPVVLAITIVATLAFLINQEAAISVNMQAGDTQSAQTRYAAEAGLQHAIWKVQQANCDGYTDLPATPFGPYSYSASFKDAAGNPTTSGSPTTIDVTVSLGANISYSLARNNAFECISVCDANYSATTHVNEFSTSAYNSKNIKGITFFAEGKSFNGAISPASGSWISVDSGKDKIYMTDLAGALLASSPTPGSTPTGITFIGSGSFSDHLAISDYFGQSVDFVDLNGGTVSSVSTSALGTPNPVDVAFIGSTASGTYDAMLAVLAEDGFVYIINQPGALQISLDLSGSTGQVEGIVHLPGKNLLMIADRGLDQNLIIDFDGNLINSYPIDSFGSGSAYAITVNPETCEHVIGDLGVDKVITLGN